MLSLKTTLKLSLIPVAFISLSALAVPPLEPITKKPNYILNGNQRSNVVQGVGNRILDVASSAKYQLYHYLNDDKEYAFRFNRVSIANEQYTGNPADIANYIFFELWYVIDGSEVKSGQFQMMQITSFGPSQYNNAIRLMKMDRDERRVYEFDLGIDSQNRLFTIRNDHDVTYFTPSETHKKYVSFRDKHPEMIF
ncbi:MAG TPA: hypothetical protein VF682_19895 [Pseudomonas sp.]